MIVNLQKTPKDRKADLKIHARVDDVMALLMWHLRAPIPTFVRADWLSFFVTTIEPAAKKARRGSRLPACDEAAPAGGQSAAAAVKDEAAVAAGWGFDLCISSLHGRRCPLPMLRRAVARFPGLDDEDEQELDTSAPPLVVSLRDLPSNLCTVRMHVTLHFSDAADDGMRRHALDCDVTRGEPTPKVARAALPVAALPAPSAPKPSLPAADGEHHEPLVTQQQSYAAAQLVHVCRLTGMSEAAVAAAAAARSSSGAAAAATGPVSAVALGSNGESVSLAIDTLSALIGTEHSAGAGTAASGPGYGTKRKFVKL